MNVREPVGQSARLETRLHPPRILPTNPKRAPQATQLRGSPAREFRIENSGLISQPCPTILKRTTPKNKTNLRKIFRVVGPEKIYANLKILMNRPRPTSRGWLHIHYKSWVAAKVCLIRVYIKTISIKSGGAQVGGYPRGKFLVIQRRSFPR